MEKCTMLRRLVLLFLAGMTIQGLAAAGVASAFLRGDAWVQSEPGVRLFVREVRASTTEELGVPVLLIHGAGPGSLANFDPSIPFYSLAEDIASVGHVVYLMDVRGFGNSAKPAAMDSNDESTPPAASSAEALRDISAVVNWVIGRSRESKVALVGLGAGGYWAALYTVKNSEKVTHLVMLNTLYGVKAPWPMGKTFADPKNPDAFNPSAGAYRLVDAAGLMAEWDGDIPVADKSKWHDSRVTVAYVRLALAGDVTANTRKPPSIRIPLAVFKEHFEMSQGKKLWDAKDIVVPTLYVRGTRDHWSRPEDLQALNAELVNAPSKEIVVIHDASHFLLLDRPEKGRAAFIQELLVFIGNRQPAGKEDEEKK
jgi:pimeloyl-ACP methyl ester carboxylesterase